MKTKRLLVKIRRYCREHIEAFDRDSAVFAGCMFAAGITVAFIA